MTTLPKISGVYAITNTIDSKIYIGSSVNVHNRTNAHRNALAANRHTNEHLQRAFNVHGFAAFKFSIIEACPPEGLIDREQWHIDNSKCWLREFGYNLRPTAAAIAVSHETKAKLRAAILGTKRGPMSAEQKEKLSAAKRGRKLAPHVAAMLAQISRERARTPEERAKIGASNRGRKRTPEARARMSAAKGGKRPKMPKVRQPLSAESRAKISATLKGHPVSAATRAKISARLLGNTNASGAFS